MAMMLWLALAWMAGTVSGTNQETVDSDVAPVVIELFTSQGCSSCPPADALWQRLGDEPALRARVVPLAFHVDYWDSLGWRDPFSSATWSARQNAYAHAFGSSRIYTPQAVVAGRTECVGSDEREVRDRIAEAERRPRGRLTLRRVSADRLAVSAAPPKSSSRPLEVMVAIYERQRSTQVGRGENGGRTLQNAFIVRRLDTAFVLAPSGSAPVEREIELRLDPAWQGMHLGAAVFLQDPVTREIFGGRSIEL